MKNLLNHIHITTRHHSSYKPLGDFDRNGVTINCEKEGWTLHIDTTDGGDNRELARIKFLRGNRVWEGSITDLMCMSNYALNSLNLLCKLNQQGTEETEELKALLSSFKIETSSLPSTDATHERGKEMAMISCIMSTHFFDDMVASSRSGGVIASYDRIADWADEFYNLYRNFNWEDMVHADGKPCEFPKANGWEDVVILFTREKMKDFPNP